MGKRGCWAPFGPLGSLPSLFHCCSVVSLTCSLTYFVRFVYYCSVRLPFVSLFLQTTYFSTLPLCTPQVVLSTTPFRIDLPLCVLGQAFCLFSSSSLLAANLVPAVTLQIDSSEMHCVCCWCVGVVCRGRVFRILLH